MTVKKVNEVYVKKKVIDYLKELGIYYFFPVASGYMRNGVPDIVCCIKGKFVAIECKAGKNTTTAIQDKNIEQIKLNGGVAIVVNENNLDYMREVVDEIRKD